MLCGCAASHASPWRAYRNDIFSIQDRIKSPTIGLWRLRSSPHLQSHPQFTGKMVSKLLVLSALVALVVAKPMSRNMKLHESVENAPAGFVRSGAADADKELSLRIALVQSNTEGLIDALYSVSTPDSPSYSEHLSKEEVSSIVDFLSYGRLICVDVARSRNSSSLLLRPRRL